MFATFNYILNNTKIKPMSFVIILLCISSLQLGLSAYYSWDNSTSCAHFYTINEGKATRSDRQGRMYLLTTKESVPKGISTISIRINSNGQDSSWPFIFVNLGLITQKNKQLEQVYYTKGSVEYESIRREQTAKMYVDDWGGQYLSQLFVAAGQTIELQINTDKLEVGVNIVSKHLVYPVQLNEQYWQNENIYVFFESNNFGAEVELLT